ncbi:hypothetical protein [Marimonas arenosa]|uniref:Uncharacterized protein n=1 Tax=Marimonas arenosa TaxID=1795305 RepID=A0AAE4B3F0_9RHOB|nr:hypothetical protein [Marimonas arenosa]MDQ2088294.1 hypothetical protein [Marimonas arenosa]
MPDVTNANHDKPRFLFAEESGLALFENRHTGRRFWLDLEDWQDIVDCLRSGWSPDSVRSRQAQG